MPPSFPPGLNVIQLFQRCHWNPSSWATSCRHRGNLTTQSLIWLGTQTLTCIPNILHYQLYKWVWMFTYSEIPAWEWCKPQQNLLQGPLLKGEGHYSAHCPLLLVLSWFSRRILSMKTVRIPNWNSFQRRLTFSMAQQFSLLRKAILFQSEEGIYYFRI